MISESVRLERSAQELRTAANKLRRKYAEYFQVKTPRITWCDWVEIKPNISYRFTSRGKE